MIIIGLQSGNMLVAAGRKCLYCGSEIPYDSTRSKQWNEQHGRKFCSKEHWALYRMTQKPTTYLRLLFMTGGLIIKDVHDKLGEEVDIHLVRLLDSILKDGFSPSSGPKAMIESICLGKAIYTVDPKHFVSYNYDYRKAFQFNSGPWMEFSRGHGLLILLQRTNLMSLVHSWAKDYNNGNRERSAWVGKSVVKTLHNRLKSLGVAKQYRESTFEAFIRVYKKHKVIMDPKCARDIGTAFIEVGHPVDYRCLMPKYPVNKYQNTDKIIDQIRNYGS